MELLRKIRMALSGYKTYLVGLGMIGTGAGKLLGIDLPWIEVSTDSATLIGNGLGMMGVRAGVSSSVERVLKKLSS